MPDSISSGSTNGAGNGRLEEATAAMAQASAALTQAMATLIQNQASFLTRMAENDKRMVENDKRMAETDARMAETNRVNSERFARIETLLFEYNRILAALPEAIREKIGFKTQ